MTLVVCPLEELEDAIEVWRPSHVISLASPGAGSAPIPVDLERLRVTFHDIAEPRPDLRAADAADVERLLAFAQAWPRRAPLIVHCWAGVSRSPAAAYAIASMVSGAGSEAGLAHRLREVAPFATPNARVVALADAALSRRGAMVRAIAAIGRGAETSLGRSFALPFPS